MVHRLVLSAWLPRLGAALAACLAVYCAVELVDLSNVVGGPPLGRYPLRIPFALVLVTPVALLASGSWAATHLARTGQLVGLSAAGADPRRSLLSLPAAGCLVAAALFVVADQLAPRALSAWSAGLSAAGEAEGRWVTSGRTLYRLGRPQGSGYEDVVAITRDPEGLPVERVEAARAARGEDGAWILEEAVVIVEGEPPSAPEARLPAPAPIPRPTTTKAAQHLPGPELERAAREARGAGLDPAPLRAERGLRVGLALCCPVLLLLGVVVGARLGGRRGSTVAAAAAVAVVSWLALASSFALASSGEIPPQAVALGPALLLGPPAIVAWATVLR